MSTKTTFKRIALVTVAALGFGVLTSVAPASAYTGSMSLSTTSLTVVGSGTTTNAGYFYVDTFNEAGDATALTSAESITVSVVGRPQYRADGTTASTAGDLTIGAFTRGTTVGANTAAVTGAQAATAASYQIPSGSAAATAFASSSLNTTSTVAAASNRYYFAVYPTATTAIDSGEFTLRVRLYDANTFTTDTTVKVKFVSSAADSGAKIAVATTGTFNKGQSIAFTSAQKITATLTDANGGKVQVGRSLSGVTIGSFAPTILGQIVNVDGVTKDETTEADTGVAAADMVASTSTTAQVVLDYALSQEGNGVYGLTASTITADAAVDNVIRVRYGSTSTSATLVTLATSAAIDGKTDLTLTAAGVLAADQLIKSDVATTTAYTLPTSAKSAKLRINIDNASNDAIADQPITVKTTWSGNFATANVSPATTTTTTSNTDASGNLDLTITNSAPLAGAVATVTITGYGYTAGTSRGTAAGSSIVTLTWAAPVATTITVIDPTASVKVKTGSTNVLTVSVKDQFGALMSGESLQPSLSSTSSNYSASKTYDAITTGSAGTATFSLTDAKAVTAKSDAVSFASISNSSATAGSFTLSYVDTLPVVSTMTGYYNNDATGTASTLVPSTGVYADSGAKLIIKNDRDLTKTLAAVGAATTDDMVAFRVKAVDSTGAAATGAAVTITAPTGGHVLNSSGLPSSSRTIAVDVDGYVAFQLAATAPGSLTFTATSGTISSTITLVVAVPTAAAGRTVAVTGATTATANSDGVPMTVTVKDRYGNAVDGVTLTLAATGVAAFAGGATTQSFTTDSTGTYTFMAKSYTAAGGAGTYKVSAGNATDASSIAGYVGATAVDSTLAAGISSASATVTFGAGEDAAAANAQAATDAAAEATDAANAATDAANAAAEAADAATAAAQDAADAVAALSAQVSSLISGLKSQLTALTNLVIKIQKKVKA
jgi:trimeric autotransporter adhesin